MLDLLLVLLPALFCLGHSSPVHQMPSVCSPVLYTCDSSSNQLWSSACRPSCSSSPVISPDASTLHEICFLTCYRFSSCPGELLNFNCTFLLTTTCKCPEGCLHWILQKQSLLCCMFLCCRNCNANSKKKNMSVKVKWYVSENKKQSWLHLRIHNHKFCMKLKTKKEKIQLSKT